MQLMKVESLFVQFEIIVPLKLHSFKTNHSSVSLLFSGQLLSLVHKCLKCINHS